MSQSTFTALIWAFVLYEAIVFVSVVVIMLVVGRSVPAGVKIEDESAGERAKVLAFLVGFLVLLVVVFFIGS